MIQRTLFPDREPLARARHTDPEVSHQAAASVDLSRSQALVLEVLKDWPRWPMTADEIEKRLQGCVSPSRVRGALTELRERDPPPVVIAGSQPNEGGHAAQTYKAVENRD